ncbi:MAG: class II aldolase/adducin family protein [Oscillochloridaceae bacterium]|nr:class II aldolase/adducin family protein [Chloroflexaceae bacterium]MDW8390129.1 class II aldolase/adducin family protein [Oscillochloridaceae bacterium]
MADEAALRLAIVQVGRRLYQRGLIAASDGNISARLPDGTILITPAGMCKGELEPDDLVVVDCEGALLRAKPDRRQSSEQLLHLHIYRRRPDALACVHAHPPTAVALTLAGISMAEPLLPEAVLSLGPVPTAPYARTGTAEMGAAVDDLIGDHNAVLLSHHGALTLGRTPLEAYYLMEQLEHCARIIHAAALLGPIQRLPPERIEELRTLRHVRRRDETLA